MRLDFNTSISTAPMFSSLVGSGLFPANYFCRWKRAKNAEDAKMRCDLATRLTPPTPSEYLKSSTEGSETDRSRSGVSWSGVKQI